MDKNLYIYWLKKHENELRPLFSRENDFSTIAGTVYRLRCSLLHEGILYEEGAKIIFVDRDSMTVCGDYIFLPVETFCETIFDTAKYSIFELLPQKSIKNIPEITPFNGISMDSDSYRELQEKLDKKYEKFWNAHSKDDHVYNTYYDIDFPPSKKLGARAYRVHIFQQGILS